MIDHHTQARRDWIKSQSAEKPLFPPGFSYRPPVERVCICGAKHQGPWQVCSPCRDELSSGK